MYDDELPCGFGDIPMPEPPTQTQTRQCQECQCQKCKCKEEQPVIEVNKRERKICFKCKVQMGSLLYKNQSMCKECALRNVEYKCRVNMQNKIKIRQQDRLLVGLSGGMNSICLVNVLRQLQIRFQKHFLFDQMLVVHIDLSILAENPQEYRRNIEKLIIYSKEREFKLEIVPLESIYQKQPERIKSLINGFRQGADQGDLIDMMIERLLLRMAEKYNMLYTKGTIGQRVAANIFKTIVKGNGGNIGDLAFRNGNVLQPLRQHLSKEVQFYFHFKKLDRYFFQPPVGNNHKINDILEDFIDALQDTYAHTCPTILRTSEKIKANQDKYKCTWCEATCNDKLCMRCRRIRDHWISSTDPIEHFLPECFL